MDAMARADACSCTMVDDVLPCENVAAAVRRRRIEIRRFRILANSGGGNPTAAAAAAFGEPLKRTRVAQQSSLKPMPEESTVRKKCRENSGNLMATLTRTTSSVEDSSSSSQVVAHHQSGSLVREESEQQEARELVRHHSCSSCPQEPAETRTSAPSCSARPDSSTPAYGKISVCGRRREMEDAVAVALDFITLPCPLAGCTSCSTDSTASSKFHFFGVYDGHSGAQAAHFCRDRLHHALVEEMRTLQADQALFEDQKECWRRALSSCFLKVDEEVRNPCVGEGCSKCGGEGCEGPRVPENVGSTAVVAVVGGNQIVVANCGDSRAVLSRGGRAIPLSSDHKPGRPDEMARVEAAGGKVINWDVHRIWGILAMSRSIGDKFMSEFVIADPEVTCTTRTDEDECLILASDGLWDKVSNEDACEIARRCLATGPRGASSGSASTSSLDGEAESPATRAASTLIKKALGNGSKDNISVVVVDLVRSFASSIKVVSFATNKFLRALRREQAMVRVQAKPSSPQPEEDHTKPLSQVAH